MLKSEIVRLISVTDCVLWTKDPATRKITGVSENFSRMTGFPESEIIGKCTQDLFVPQVAVKIEEHEKLALETGEPTKLDLKFAGKVWTVTALKIIVGDCPVVAKVAVPRLG